jgi:four helix bundle protein
MRNFRDLEIWKNSIAFSKSIYEICSTFPDKERFGLTAQIQRASVAIPSNIAEGSSRSSQADFARFLEIALGSAFEVETQLNIAKEVGYISSEQLIKCHEELTIIQKQINQLITVIRNKK